MRDLSSRSGEFQHVVRTADQTPLTGDLRQAPEQELPEAAPVFDLAKHGFHYLLSKPIATAVRGASQTDPHCVHACSRSGLAQAGG